MINWSHCASCVTALAGCCPGTYGIWQTDTHQLVLRRYILEKLTNINHSGNKSFSTMFWSQMGKYLRGTTPTYVELFPRITSTSNLSSCSHFIDQQNLLKHKILTCIRVIISINSTEPEHSGRTHNSWISPNQIWKEFSTTHYVALIQSKRTAH